MASSSLSFLSVAKQLQFQLQQWKTAVINFKPTAIRSKIASGYLVALGIPIIGASIGILIGNHYQAAADQKLAEYREDQKRLLDLQINILSNLPAKSLSPFTHDPVTFRKAGQALIKRIETVSELTEGMAIDDRPLFTQNRTAFKQYATVVAEFSRFVQRSIEVIQPLTGSVKNQYKVDAEIGKLLRSQEFNNFIAFTNVLESLNIDANQELLTAVQERREAENFRLMMAIGSIFLALLVSVLLGNYTSRTIAQPIEDLASLAQQVTHDANTRLRADVTTVDEVGTLAQSVNQLIEWVENYTRDLQAAQLQLVQTEKMSSLGELVGGLAHEINNPISFIYGNLGYVDQYVSDLIYLVKYYQEKYPQDETDVDMEEKIEELEFVIEDLPKLLISMKSGAERIRELVVSLRNFSRLDEADLKTVDLHEGLENTLLMLNYRLQHCRLEDDIQITKHYGDLPEVECYPAQLNQVFMNVLDNAIDVLSDESILHPEITLSTRVIDSQWVQLSIADNGPGIEEAIQSKLFDPFFTTKPIGQGTGLGLAIAYQVVQQHEGQIQVISAPGQGTTIQIELPIRQKLEAEDTVKPFLEKALA
ncbi:HAMP domain-containing histidine kinase [Limnothrix sp. FACHB-881]|uniref:sensor histidine kinase n=1 Tax=Limnothrix sp. FACHB-881 TaxID=2692819 RepID=UPI001685284B|nr:ATP-binding protein [Limnothrix sp. FACHB-881]MBD2637067.1 HAMP domain-containing histidine kinase [Limnothrix sp. FACHB-881]